MPFYYLLLVESIFTFYYSVVQKLYYKLNQLHIQLIFEIILKMRAFQKSKEKREKKNVFKTFIYIYILDAIMISISCLMIKLGGKDAKKDN